VDTFLEQVFNGISLGSILFLAAVGLTFTFGQMGVINMAHGELIMLGAYTPYVLQTEVAFLVGATSFAYVLSIPLAFLAAGLVGVLMEWLLLQRMYDRPLDTLLVTFGVSLLLQQAAKDYFGQQNVNVTAPSWLDGNVEILGVVLPYTRLFIIGLVVVVLAIISVVLTGTPQGRRMRAVTENRDLAAVSGLAYRRVDRLTFFIGSGLAGVAGTAIALIGAVGFQIGLSYIIDAFLVVIVGGLGKLRGAVIAAFALGLVNAFAEYWTNASIGKAILFALVIAFLQFRPNGIVSFRQRGLTS
jgi:urea transport system permease protein